MTIVRDVIAIEIDEGRTVLVTPLSPFVLRAISQRANEKFPDPDPTPYEKPRPGALVPGTVIPADEDAEYVSLKKEVQMQRNLYIQAGILSMTEIEGVSREELVATYKDVLAQVRQYGNFPEDDYVMPLTQEEIRDGMRIFRPDLQRNGAGGNHRAQSAPDIPEAGQVQAQQSAG
jgi:hypothetical protein